MELLSLFGHLERRPSNWSRRNASRIDQAPGDECWTKKGTIGTNASDSCPDDPPDDAWPCDFDMNTVVNITDVFNVLPPYFGTSPPNPNYSVRRDLVPDGVINISDVFEMLGRHIAGRCKRCRRRQAAQLRPDQPLTATACAWCA